MNRKLITNGIEIVYTLTRKKMKNIRVMVTKDGEVTVSAPVRASIDIIEKFMTKEIEWIVDRIEEMKKRADEGALAKGEILLAGKKYTIEKILGRNCIKIDTAVITISIKEEYNEYIREVFEKWLREYAREYFYERVRKLAKLTGRLPENVVIKDQKRAWGSCSTKGNINLNWRLIMAPPEVIDYVILHELCHMIHMNHSQEYWELVALHMPDYKEKRKWLKENGGTLQL